jgi:hypothetical protein
VILRALDPEEIDARAERHDEVVVLGRGHLGELHLPSGEVQLLDPGLVDGDVRLLVEEIADRMSYGGRLEQVGRHLVQQRLERVVIVLVDEDDVRIDVSQCSRRADPCEPSAEDQNGVLGALAGQRMLLSRSIKSERTAPRPRAVAGSG